jgi:ABC-type uncharacterized transport system permease subunit
MNRRDSVFLMQFLTRVGGAILVVMLTYNPTGWSFYHWVTGGGELNLPLVVLSGIALLVAYAVLVRSTLYSIGKVGVVLVAALVAALVWLLVDQGVIDLKAPGVIDWVALLGIGFILGVGLSWAIIRRRLSGQNTVDEPGVDLDHEA